MDAIVIPVKRFENAKLRLSRTLAAKDRRELGLAMLEDVLEATRAWPLRIIVTAEEALLPMARATNCLLIADEGKGLNDAVNCGIAAGIAAGATQVAVLPCDVPMVKQSDVARLFSSQAGVALTPSSDGGTNALMLRPPSIIRTAFGPASAEAHLAAAALAHVEAETLHLESLSLDIDSLDDLISLSQSNLGLRSVQTARELVCLEAEPTSP